MEYVVSFLFSFILIYIIYYFFFIRKTTRGVKVPAEVQCLIALYKLDVNKFSYKKFVRDVGLVTSLDISIVATIITNVGDVIWQILFGFVAVVPVCVISFILIGRYYQNKQNMDNSLELEEERKYLEELEKKKKKKTKTKSKEKTNTKSKKKGR